MDNISVRAVSGLQPTLANAVLDKDFSVAGANDQKLLLAIFCGHFIGVQNNVTPQDTKFCVFHNAVLA